MDHQQRGKRHPPHTDTDHETLLKLGRRLRKALESEDYVIDNRALQLRVSIGISVATDQNYLRLLEQSRQACVLARNSARDGVHLYQRPGLARLTGNAPDGSAPESLAVDDPETIQEALSAQRFRLVFQPIVSLQDNRAERYEVLLRVYNQMGQELPTAKVFEFVRQQQVSVALDRWVISQSIVKLQERRAHIADTILFINISSFTLDDETLPGSKSLRQPPSTIPSASLGL